MLWLFAKTLVNGGGLRDARDVHVEKTEKNRSAPLTGSLRIAAARRFAASSDTSQHRVKPWPGN